MTPEISLWGLTIIIFAVLMHIAGTILYVFSISGFSIFFLAIGSSLFLFGRKIASEIKFPLSFLIFMFPLPLAILTAVSFPMKLIVAKAGVAIVNFLGFPVFREGFNITTSAGNMVVGNPCSGMRSLISFLALGALLAYFTNTSNVKKFIIFILAIPVAILSNMVRVPTLILISHFWGLKAAAPESLLHDASGLLVFVIGFIMLFATSRIVEWKS
jgi:exosortase